MDKKPKPPSWYDDMVKRHTPPRPVLANCIRAFFSGGLLCGLAQAGSFAFRYYGQMTEDEATSTVIIIVIALAALITGLGLFDKIAQNAGAGLAVPITGFANSVAAAMLEHKSEGYVLGSGCNSFKLAGAVVLFGIVSAFFVVLIALIFGYV